MLGRHRRLWFACASALLLRAATAQERAELVPQPTFARVETAAGEPLANAVVTFAGCLPHAGTDAGPHDVHQVQTDARGRARASLQANLCYVAWAVGPADGAGRCAVSPVRGWLGAGAVLTLRCDEPQPPRHIAIEGSAAWAKQGPLRFVALTLRPGSETELSVGDDARLVVPPGLFEVIEVRTARGEPLWHTLATKDVVALPPPQSLRVRVVDEKGAPLSGAVVRHRVVRLRAWRIDSVGGVVTDRWRELGTTDQQGRCTVEVPYDANPLQEHNHGELLLFASHRGGPAVAGGVLNRVLYIDDRKVAKAPGDELVFTCGKAEPLAGRVFGLPAGAVAQLSATCKLLQGDNGYTHDARSFHVPVGADGAFAFTDLPAEIHACRLTFVLPGDSPRPSPQFPSRRGRELPPEVRADARAPPQDAFADVQLRVIDQGGGPARGLVAIVVPAGLAGLPVRDSATRVPLDARGAAALRVAAGKWVVMVASDNGWGARCVDLGPADHEIPLAMQPMATMRVELRNDRDWPLAGARVVVRNTTSRGTNDVLQSVLSSLRSQTLGEWARLRTDAAGRVTIPFVPLETMTQRLALTWEGGASAEFVLEANDGWLVVGPK